MVDIILPIYKPGASVFDAIDSVLKQSFTHWKLYIIDDASNDGMLQKIRTKYIEYSDKISFLELKKNLRAAGARNFAIKEGNSKYIAFLDQDDIWLQEKLSIQVTLLEKHSYDAIHSNIMLIDADGNNLKKECRVKENSIRENQKWDLIDNYELAKRIFKYPNIRIISSVVRRRSLEKIGGFHSEFFGGEDETFWFEMAMHSKIGFTSKILIQRREHSNNTVNVYMIQRIKGYLTAIKYIKEKYPHVIGELYDNKEKSLNKRLINALYKNSRFKEFLKNLFCFLFRFPSESLHYVSVVILKFLLVFRRTPQML